MSSTRDTGQVTSPQDFSSGDWPVMPTPKFISAPIHHPAIGLLELSVEVCMAKEISAFLPKEAAFHTSRMAYGERTTVDGLSDVASKIPEAADLLPAAECMHVIVFGCTSGSIVIGKDKVAELIHQSRPDVPVITPIGAVLAGIKALNIKKIAVITPYVAEVNKQVAQCLANEGVEIVSARTFAQESADDMFMTVPEAFLEAALDADVPEAEGFFISCTGIIVSPIIRKLEEITGKPVVTSNQAIAWQCREITGIPNAPDDMALFHKRYKPDD